MIITLSWHEVWQASIAGVARRVSALRNQRGDRYGKPAADLWGMDIEADCAEMALAKHLGRYWVPAASDPASIESDVGGGHQCRSTPRADGCLILHPGDADGHTFWLVTGHAPELVIVGSITGAAGKQEKWWRGQMERPAFFVPQSALRSADGQ